MERFDWLEVDKPKPAPGAAPEPEFDARHYLRAADLAYGRGGYESALRHYGKALGEDSGLAEAWLGQVLCLTELGELDEAKLWSGKALDRFPESAELLAARGLALARLGEGADAMVLSDRAIAKKEASARVWLLRGLTLLRLDPWSRPEGCFLKAQEGAPRDAALVLRIGMGYLDERNLPAAKDYLLRAAEADSGNPLAWARLGQCFEGLFAHDRARECYERALALKPDFRAGLVESLGRLANVGFFARVEAFWRGLWSSDHGT